MIPIPKPCILDELISLGFLYGSKRWTNIEKNRLYTWDSFHGEIEVFSKRGKHLGVINCEGNFIKEAIKGRKIDV